MKIFTSAFSLQPSALKNWLPDMDLNHDKQIQSLLCYRYTIGQAGASNRLNALHEESRFVESLNCYTVKSCYVWLTASFTVQRFNGSTVQRN
jgi:hypothetical protein